MFAVSVYGEGHFLTIHTLIKVFFAFIETDSLRKMFKSKAKPKYILRIIFNSITNIQAITSDRATENKA